MASVSPLQLQNPSIQNNTRTSQQPPLSAPINFKLPEYLIITKEKRKQLVETNTVTVKSFLDIINTSAPGNRRKILYPNSQVDEYGNTLLHLAVAHLDLDLISVLLLKGANPNLKNYAGTTPIALAYLMNLPIKYLRIMKRHSNSPFIAPEKLSGDSNSGNYTQDGGEEPESVKKSIFKYDFPRYYVPDDSPNMSFINIVPGNNQQSLEPGAVSTPGADGYGATALMKAAYKNHHLIVSKLLQLPHPDVPAVDQRGFNAMIYACLGGALESLQLILDRSGSFETIMNVNISANSNQMMPLMAAVVGGNIKCVELLFERGQCDPQTISRMKWKGLDLLQMAVVNAQMEIAVFLKRQLGSNLPELSFQGESNLFVKWLHFVELGSRSPKNLITVVKTMPNGKSAATYASAFFEKVSPQGFAQIKEDKTWEPFLHLYGMRLMVNALGKLKSKPSDELLKQLVPESEYRQDLVTFFKTQGTQLDQVLMTIARDVITLVDAANANNKAQYVLIASRAVQNCNEILRLVEAYMLAPAPTPGQKNPQPSAASSIFNSTKLYGRIRDVCKQLKNDDIKALLLACRIAVGAWPPPDAMQNMIKAAIKLSQGFQNLVNLANATGFWALGQIDLKQLLNGENSQMLSPQSASTSSGQASPASPLSYSEYQRQNENKVLNQIAASTAEYSNSSAASPIQTSNSQLSGAQSQMKQVPQSSPADENFFASLDNLVRQFVQAVQTLKQANAESQKATYASAAASIYARIDAIFEEIAVYYIFKSMEDNFSVDGQITYKKKMAKYRELLFGAADGVILKSKLAAGVWPPPGAADEMIKATLPCVVGVKECVDYVKKAVRLIRNTENEERRKMEAFMSEWEHSAKVRNVFNQWEQLQMVALKDEEETGKASGAAGGLPGGDLTPDQVKLLDDGLEGLVLETAKDGKEIVKGGRLTKLVEKLADHNYVDPEYRTAFLLTYPSFTNALDLLDLLMKRYDIGPPYGLDQKMFEVYVNRKIIPVRLRVYNVLKVWMSKYTEDFTKNRQLTEKCLQFVETKMSADFGDITNVLLQTLKRTLQGTPAAQPIIETNKQPPKSLLPKGIGIDELVSFLSYHERAFIDIDPVEFARQITIIDSLTFKDIRPKECLDQGWEKANKHERSPNICRMIKNTNDLTMWVASSIVKCEDIKARVNLIRYFVNVANACRDLNNFNAITAFVAGLTMGPVFRMTKTWTVNFCLPFFN